VTLHYYHFLVQRPPPNNGRDWTHRPLDCDGRGAGGIGRGWLGGVMWRIAGVMWGVCERGGADYDVLFVEENDYRW